MNTQFSMKVLHAELPKTLSASNVEHYDPNRQGGRVQIRFVPEEESIPNKNKYMESLQPQSLRLPLLSRKLTKSL